jgi:hypothetical protein
MLPKHHHTHKQQRNQCNRYGYDPSLKSVLLPISPRKYDRLACLRIPTCEGHVVDDIVNDARTAGDVDDLNRVRNTSDPPNQKAQWFQMNFILVYTVTPTTATRMNPKKVWIIVQKVGL